MPPNGPPPPGPVPVLALFVQATKLLVINWDQPLVVQPTAIGNWTAELGPIFPFDAYANPAPGAHAGATTAVTMALTDGGVAPNRCNYAATPPDAVSLATGVPALPFTDFPVGLV